LARRLLHCLYAQGYTILTHTDGYIRGIAYITKLGIYGNHAHLETAYYIKGV
jgi:hypothetical protein